MVSHVPSSVSVMQHNIETNISEVLICNLLNNFDCLADRLLLFIDHLVINWYVTRSVGIKLFSGEKHE